MIGARREDLGARTVESWRMNPFSRALVFCGVCSSIACSYTGLATETASNDLGCPQDKLVVTNPSTRNYHAVGCGKARDYYCDYVHSDPGQADDHAEVVCKPVAEVQAERQAADDKETRCHDTCGRGEDSCLQGCGDDQCRSMCRSLHTGCLEGCLGVPVSH